MNLQASSAAIPQGSFTKEQVKQRLRAQAVTLWGVQEADADKLDPVIDLLMSACAVEFERTAHQVYASQSRILEKLAELMVPEVTTSARPAHAIMHASSELPTTTVKRENLFSVDKELLEGSKSVVLPVTLSPAFEVTLFDASIVYQISKNRICVYDTPTSKSEKTILSKEASSFGSSVWFGLKLNKRIKNLKGLSFYFNWKENTDKARYIPLLSLTEWNTLEGPINIHLGLNQNETSSRQMVETDLMKPFENQVLQIYQNQFLTIQEEFSPTVFSRFPPTFEEEYSEEQLKDFKEELFWLEVRFPEGIPATVLHDLYCSVNCFPVMNRKLHAGNRPYALSPNLNIIPLIIDEHFMSVHKVFSSAQEFASIAVDKLRDMEHGTYSVKQTGVNRFDQRDSEALLHYLYELMRDESAVFKAFGNYSLHSEIKGLEQSLARLKMHFLNKPLHQSSKCHLFLNSKESDDVWVEYWTSQGETGNHISAGARIKQVTQSNVKRASLLLMTPTSGGREPLSEAEKVHAFRFALLTRSRIATEEDLKAACYAELGDKISKVEVKKGFKLELASKSGYVKTLDIILTPAPGFHDLDWNATCNEMKSYIESNKLFLTHIQVFTSNQKAYAAN